VVGAGLEHVDLVVLQDDLGLNDLQAGGTETVGEVVVDVWPGVHKRNFLGVESCCYHLRHSRYCNVWLLLDPSDAMDGWTLRSILVMGGVVLIAALLVPRLLARAKRRMNNGWKNGWKEVALAAANIAAVVVVVVDRSTA
jgi:hypothetical protein